MITVADILALPVIHSYDVIEADEAGLARKVVNIGVVDAAPEVDDYSDYVPGEFILTNMGFANNDLEVGEEAVCKMLSRNIAGLAIRNVYDFPITEAMREASRANGTPLIVYEGEFVEQVIFQGLNLIERDKADSDVSQRMDDILAKRTPEEIARLLFDAIGATGATVQIARLRPIASDDASLYAQIDSLGEMAETIKRDWRRVQMASVFRYHDSALVIIAFDRSSETFALDHDSEFTDLLKPYGAMHCGISEELPLGQSDIALRQADAALMYAAKNDLRIVRWSSMLAEAFQVAAREDRMFFDTCMEYQRLLARFDEENDAHLEETARGLADTCGDVRAVAEMLFQHPNTIRFRMKRIKSVFAMDEASDKELTRFLIMVFLAEDA